MKQVKCELFCDNFQNYKRYGIPKAQLVVVCRRRQQERRKRKAGRQRSTEAAPDTEAGETAEKADRDFHRPGRRGD